MQQSTAPVALDVTKGPTTTPSSPCGVLELRLPYTAGESYRVIQGNDGHFTHADRDRFAWDFDMPEGTPVLAAHGGVVVEVQDHHEVHGLDPAMQERANLIVVDMGGGCFAVYQHLQPRSAAVREGERVGRGQLLGRSGNTGMSTHPHLHFEVTDFFNASQPVRFVEVMHGVPKEGEAHVSANVPLEPSRLTSGVFGANGVELDEPRPTRLLARGEPLRLRGRAVRPASHVVVFFLPRAGGAPLARFLGKLDEHGRFDVTVSLAQLEGPLGLAMALLQPDGHFHSDFSVPVVVREADTHMGPPQPLHSARNL